jgi:hypothetical protein
MRNRFSHTPRLGLSYFSGISPVHRWALKFSSVTLVLLAAGCVIRPKDSHTNGAPRRVSFRDGENVQFNPAHFEGPFTVAGDFDLDPTMIAKRYLKLPTNSFGSVAMDLEKDIPLISRATGRRKYIRELHYHLGDNKIGIRPIPIVDRKDIPQSTDPDFEPKDQKSPYWDYPVEGKTADGFAVKGSELMDQLLRREYGFGVADTNAPIFALMSYLRPEFYHITFRDLGNLSYLKTENGMTHLGAYIGQGRTRNSPTSYHSFRWNLEQDEMNEEGEPLGYPANVYTVKPKWAGVDQKTFLENLHMTLRLLNELNDGVIFADDYKFDWFRAVNLKETFAFYRAWIDPNWKRNPTDSEPFLTKIKNDKSYYSYCAEHMTIVLNVALNLAQNEQGYVDVFGPIEGKALWELAKNRYENRERLVYDKDQFAFVTKVLGKTPTSGVPRIDGNKFSPLWKVHGITRPTEEATVGKSLAYPPETTADLMANLVEQYANWPDVGPVMASAVIFQFLPEVMKRTGLSAEKYFTLAVPFVIKMIKHDASTQKLSATGDALKAYEEYLKKVENGTMVGQVPVPGLRQILKPLEGLPGVVDRLITTIMTPLRSDEIKKWIAANNGKDINLEAWPAFIKDAKPDLIKARELDMSMEEGIETIVKEQDGRETVLKNVKYYVPPAVIHRIVSGMHPYDEKNLEFKAVATAMPAEQLRRSDKAPYKDYELK